ncbi:hypothetical protein J14TS2_37670 [Bacillus sp. J14TS2]|uniref:DUF2269 family protein n=1 Tax=Bacillus sp. J14TS2 TaxID=2807188 RepID=UPI001B1898A5|nr:DUF2269 family protein [Bacillus sp. J14TS2]GIN73292.1 hypothetical protein J14TS2_37670 [Bacillus sp. J14TS2]
MVLYHVLLYIHIFAAMVMVGISLANGFGKMFADRTGNVHRMASVLALTVYFNKVLIFPSLVVVALSGIGLTVILHLPLLGGWVLQATIILAVLFILFFVGNHYENRLHQIAGRSEENKQQVISDKYWSVSKRYYLTGFPVIVAILLILYLMIFQRSLF